jgi:hypothetical protein
MKEIGCKTKMMLVSLFTALLLMLTGWGAGGSSHTTPTPGLERVLAQTGQSIQFGNNIFGTIGCGETDTFSFQANAGDVVVIHVTECSDFGGVCRGACLCFDQCVELRQSNNLLDRKCTPLEGNRGTRFRTQIETRRLPTGDIYTIIVKDANDDGRGSYTLFLQRVNEPGLDRPLVPGISQPFSLSCGQVDTFTFNAREGDRVRIEMIQEGTGNIDPRIELYDSDGRVIDIPESGSINRELTSSGTFTLLAYSGVDQTGTYRINLEIESNPRVLNVPLVFAGRASEGIRQTAFVLVNTSEVTASGRLELLTSDGVAPLEVTIGGITESLFSFAIRPGGLQILETEDTTPLVQGLARVTTDAPIRANVILLSKDQTSQVVFETVYSTLTPTRALTVPVDSVDNLGPPADTGLVILNPPPIPGDQPQPAMITLQLVNQRGQQVGQVMLSVESGKLATGPNGEIIRFMSELFPVVPGIDEFQGTIIVTSSIPFSVLAVQQRGDRLTVVPGF